MSDKFFNAEESRLLLNNNNCFLPLSVLNHQRRAMLPDSPNPKRVQYVALRKVVHNTGQHQRSDYLWNAAVGQSAMHQDCVSSRRLGFCQRRFLTPSLTERSPPRPFTVLKHGQALEAIWIQEQSMEQSLEVTWKNIAKIVPPPCLCHRGNNN